MRWGWFQAICGLAGAALCAAPVWATPDVPLKGLDGAAHNVGEYIGKGKWAVVVVWAHDCHYCNEEIHEMSALHQARRDKDLTVLGVSVDGWGQADKARGFVARHKLPFVNLIAEPQQAVMHKFGGGAFVGTPTYYVYDPKGDLRGKNVGPVSKEDIEAFVANPEAKD